jgi:hypothetical protein
MTTTNIIIAQGATFQRDITLTDQNGQPLDVSGFQANAAIKRDHYTNTVMTVFETNLSPGNLSLRLEDFTTTIMVPGEYVYDVVLTDGTTTYRIAEGLATVDAGTTGID